LTPAAVEELALTQRQPMPDDGTNDGTNDGTRQLLRAGIWILVVGGLAALLTATVFGGIGRHGPHTNSGWLSLLLAMMCLPFGSMLTLLGAAKWLRNRRLAHTQRKPFN
jgi:drug/metabolite transporter (DMT)-like permease